MSELDTAARDLIARYRHCRLEFQRGRIGLLEHSRERRALLRDFEARDPEIVNRAIELLDAECSHSVADNGFRADAFRLFEASRR